MKKSLFFAAAVLLLLSGCIRYKEKMKLNTDGSGEITFSIGISEEILNMGGSQDSFKEFDEGKIKEDYSNKDGVKYIGGKTYSEGGNKWIEVSLQFDSLEKLEAASADSSKMGMMGKISFTEDADGNWKFERDISTKNETAESDTAADNMMNMMFSQYEWEYELTLPSKIISTNAESENVDNSTNTVKWVFSMASLSKAEAMTVVFGKEGTTSEVSSNYLIIAIIVVVVLVIILFFILRKKK